MPNAPAGVLSEVVGGIRSETRKASRNYIQATASVETAMKNGRLGEPEVYQLARERRFEETTVALSLLCKVEMDLVERALNLLKCADRGISAQDLDGAMHSYANLQPETAPRVRLLSHAPEGARQQDAGAS